MAWAVGQADLGPHADAGGYGGTPTALTTNVTVASNSWVFVAISWYFSANVSSVSGGGLTWTVLQNGGSASRLAIARAWAPSGLASSTAITPSFSSGDHDHRNMAGASFTGGDSSSFDANGVFGSGASGTAFTTGNVTAAGANELLVCAATVTGTGTSTVTSPAVFDNDEADNAADHTVIVGHRILTSSGTYTIAGSGGWGGPWFAVAIAMAPAAEGTVGVPVLRRGFIKRPLVYA